MFCLRWKTKDEAWGCFRKFNFKPLNYWAEGEGGCFKLKKDAQIFSFLC